MGQRKKARHVGQRKQGQLMGQWKYVQRNGQRKKVHHAKGKVREIKERSREGDARIRLLGICNFLIV